MPDPVKVIDHTYKLVMRFEGGHRFWRRTEQERAQPWWSNTATDAERVEQPAVESPHLWICDSSGGSPASCDDPPHYVDLTKPIWPCRFGFSVPVRFPSGQEASTVCDAATAFWLADAHGMQIAVGQRRYKLTPA